MSFFVSGDCHVTYSLGLSMTSTLARGLLSGLCNSNKKLTETTEKGNAKMSTTQLHEMISTGEATAILPTPRNTKPITVIGTPAIRETFDQRCLQQAINSRMAPGVPTSC